MAAAIVSADPSNAWHFGKNCMKTGGFVPPNEPAKETRRHGAGFAS
jgi:hypothetical protein